MKKFLFPLLLLSTFFSPRSIHAQTAVSPIDIALSPPILQIQIKPGKQITSAFTIENKSPNDMQLTASIVPFSKTTTNGDPIYSNLDNDPFATNLTLSNASIKLNQAFTISANSHDQLLLNITVPEGAPLSDHYFSLRVTTQPQNAGNSRLSAAIASNILISVTDSDTKKPFLQIENFGSSTKPFISWRGKNIFDSSSPIKFTGQVKNLSDYFYEVRGSFQVNHQQQIRLVTPIRPVNILAFSSRELSASPSGELTFTPKITDLGNFSISISIADKTQYAYSIFIFPIKIIVGVMAVIILLLVSNRLLTQKINSGLLKP